MFLRTTIQQNCILMSTRLTCVVASSKILLNFTVTSLLTQAAQNNMDFFHEYYHYETSTVSVQQYVIITKFSFICCQINIPYKNSFVNCFFNQEVRSPSFLAHESTNCFNTYILNACRKVPLLSCRTAWLYPYCYCTRTSCTPQDGTLLLLSPLSVLPYLSA
jgi:hypothetical protein